MTRRRTFLKSSLLAGLSPLVLARDKNRKTKRRLIKPKRLQTGDTVGLIAPASNAGENEDIRYAMDVIQSLGFKVKPGKNLFQRHAYLAGTDKSRAEDLNQMFRDSQVDAIFALRGGYGTPRILPMIDYQAIAKNPKALVGYSDITALLHAIHLNTGLVTFHGPIAKQSFSPYTLSEFKKVMMQPTAPVTIGSPPPFEVSEGNVERENRLTRIVSGKAKGPLMGGNLSLLTKLMGTPYQPDFKGRILILEEVSEEPYRVDGMLTHLWLTGKLHQLAGIVFGKCTECDWESGNSFSIEEVLTSRFKPLGIPTIRGLMMGHIRDQTTFPIGIEAELDVDAGTLTLLETAVE